jgi:type II secretory ATPase GspE/PulE/Tfp pilus assembly ATPase PilB-like protein
LLGIQDEADHVAVELVNQIIKKAIQEKTSDLHFEPTLKGLRVRFRIDGQLQEIYQFQKVQKQTLMTRLKVMAGMDIAEQRLPQDGRFYFSSYSGNINCRLSTCPTLFGEKLVLRFLNTIKAESLDLKNLGMSSEQLELFWGEIHQPKGLILVTGPTGSGKTLTLYSALSAINQIEKNIVSIENPIEIQLQGINQTMINPKINLSFARLLRCFLRQDPDVIMLGEIRDEETAHIAIQAAQTGHLVLSTLHTSNVLESILRLMNLGVKGYDIASSLRLVVSQRLIKKLCSFCKKESEAIGCHICYKGYQGRTGIFEMLFLSKTLRVLIADEKISEIHSFLQKNPIMSLKEHGASKVKSEITSEEELKRVCGF